MSSISLNSGSVKIREKITNPLEQFCEQTGIAVLVVHHFTKGGGKNGVADIGGSKTLTDACRSVLSVSRNSQYLGVLDLKVIKANGYRGQGMSFAIAVESPQSAHVEWIDG